MKYMALSWEFFIIFILASFLSVEAQEKQAKLIHDILLQKEIDPRVYMKDHKIWLSDRIQSNIIFINQGNIKADIKAYDYVICPKLFVVEDRGDKVSSDTCVMGFNINTGELLWKKENWHIVHTEVWEEFFLMEPVYCKVIVGFQRSDRQKLCGISPEDGQTLWYKNRTADIFALKVSGEFLILYRNNKGITYLDIYDLDSGVLKSSLNTSMDIDNIRRDYTFTIVQNKIFCATYINPADIITIHSKDLNTGEEFSQKILIEPCLYQWLKKNEIELDYIGINMKLTLMQNHYLLLEEDYRYFPERWHPTGIERISMFDHLKLQTLWQKSNSEDHFFSALNNHLYEKEYRIGSLPINCTIISLKTGEKHSDSLKDSKFFEIDGQLYGLSLINSKKCVVSIYDKNYLIKASYSIVLPQNCEFSEDFLYRLYYKYKIDKNNFVAFLQNRVLVFEFPDCAKNQ